VSGLTIPAKLLLLPLPEKPEIIVAAQLLSKKNARGGQFQPRVKPGCEGLPQHLKPFGYGLEAMFLGELLNFSRDVFG
jgi:hypothetical protein